jgi:hypothetical protein
VDATEIVTVVVTGTITASLGIATTAATRTAMTGALLTETDAVIEEWRSPLRSWGPPLVQASCYLVRMSLIAGRRSSFLLRFLSSDETGQTGLSSRERKRNMRKRVPLFVSSCMARSMRVGDKEIVIRRRRVDPSKLQAVNERRNIPLSTNTKRGPFIQLDSLSTASTSFPESAPEALPDKGIKFVHPQETSPSRSLE